MAGIVTVIGIVVAAIATGAGIVTGVATPIKAVAGWSLSRKSLKSYNPRVSRRIDCNRGESQECDSLLFPYLVQRS